MSNEQTQLYAGKSDESNTTKYTIHAHIKHGDNGVLELFERDFETDNKEGDATREACKIVLDRVLEGEDWYPIQLFLISDQGIEKIDWFDMCIVVNICLEKFRKNVLGADNQQGRT